MLKKLMIRTWRGPLPEWTPQFRIATSRLSEYGWDFIIVDNWDSVESRIKSKFGIDLPPNLDTRKAGDYDPLLGVLFEEELKGYDFWGHFNLDCVYGRIDRWLPDAFLGVDIFGNDPGAVCGPFTVYKNCEKVNQLFRGVNNVYDPGDWKGNLKSPTFYGWDEGHFSHHVHNSALNGEIIFASGFFQAHDHLTNDHRRLANDWKAGVIAMGPVRILPDGTLVDNVTSREIMMYHFNQTRKWPVAPNA